MTFLLILVVLDVCERKERERKEKEKDDKEKDKKEEKMKEKDKAIPAPSPAPSPKPTSTHQRYTLHRDFFAMRLAVHRKRRQSAQAKEVAPRLPITPRGPLQGGSLSGT